MNKVDKLKELNYQEFKGISISILEKIGYENIKNVSEDCVTGEYKAPIGFDLHGMLLLMDKLEGGKEEAKNVEEKLSKLSTKYSFSTCIIISKDNISNSVKSRLSHTSLKIQYIDRDELIGLIDIHQSNYWYHKDTDLLDYEQHFCDHIVTEIELKKLKVFNDKYKKLVDIFIEPRLYHLQYDPESDNPAYKRSSLTKLAKLNVPAFITGDAGTGKTTILKKIGEALINLNRENPEQKKLPVFITQTDLIDHEQNLKNILKSKFESYFEQDVDSLLLEYQIVILMDSIDEFEEKDQALIINQLENLYSDNKINYYMASRQFDNTFDTEIRSKSETYLIEKFDDGQIKKFISKFFSDQSRGEDLLEALRDNRILEQLPITPLSLSLIAILFEERNFEIPATITDIYDNFNLLLLGKASVKSRYEFIDINFKERILSLYSYEILNRPKKKPMTHGEFHQFFVDYFASKTIPIEQDQLNGMLDYLIKNSGLLYIRDQKYVQFKHDSFMEYYAALEIFKHKRDKEALLVEKFFDINWQNTAIFYAGKSRDMSVFLEKIIKKVRESNEIQDFLSGIMGLGYLLQALYQTDNLIRKDGVMAALDKNIEAFDLMKKLAADENIVAFKRMKLPIIGMFSLMYFYENFNSITLKDPLRRSFDDLKQSYTSNPSDITSAFKALKLATVLSSNRVNDQKALEELVYDTNLLQNPMMNLLAEFSLEFDWNKHNKEIQKEIRKQGKNLSKPIRTLIDKPTGSLRFTAQDQIQTSKRIKLITEGKTDTEIIEHAFMILTGNKTPYWSIIPAGNSEGGASELTKTLMNGKPLIEDDQLIIGIFDNDAKGIQEFSGGLRSNVFELLEGSKRIKKHKDKDIFALKLPIHADRHNYIQEDQNFNFFAIEHYFDDEILENQGMFKKTSIPDIFQIADGSKKKTFSKFIRQQKDAKIFRHFIDLFREIDRITNTTNVQYNY